MKIVETLYLGTCVQGGSLRAPSSIILGDPLRAALKGSQSDTGPCKGCSRPCWEFSALSCSPRRCFWDC